MQDKKSYLMIAVWFMICVTAIATKYHIIAVGSFFIFVYELLNTFYWEDPMD